jgi:RHH-type transcriptional regulator, rel operon repressor / antitoxin RelB
MTESKVLTLRLDPKLRKKLDRLAEATQRSRAFLAAEAVREYVALNEWQIEEIKKGLREAEQGDFATDKEVQQSLRKWTRSAN